MKSYHALFLARRVALQMYAVLIVSSFFASTVYADFSSSVPLSEDVSNSIVESLFPRTHDLGQDRLFASNPSITYAPRQTGTPRRVILKVSLQILTQHPGEALTATAPGWAQISGELGYDASAAQILLSDPQIDRLDLSALGTQEVQVKARLHQEWLEKVTDPMRVNLPNHPLLIPFRYGIQDISLEDEGIVIEVVLD